MGNYSRIRGENQSVFIGTGMIFGINSLQISNNFGESPIKYIGLGNKDLNQSVASAQYADLSIAGSFIQEDILIQQTGTQPFNCFICQDKNNVNTYYSLVSGYVSTYNAKYATNQVPQINCNLRFYNNAGNIPQTNLDAYSSGQINSIISNIYPIFNDKVADSNYINLTLDEYNTNRVQDFSFTLGFNRLPIFNVGSRAPKKIETIFPINVTCDITFEATDGFSDATLTDFPLNKRQQNISLSVYSNRTNNIMANYSFSNFTLVSNDNSLNTEGNKIISRQYVGQLFSFSGAS